MRHSVPKYLVLPADRWLWGDNIIQSNVEKDTIFNQCNELENSRERQRSPDPKMIDGERARLK